MMSFLLILLISLIKCVDTKTDEIKPVNINGEPRFIIGNYHNPQDLGELKRYAENGFNLVRCTPDTNALDMVKDAGLNAWVNTGELIDFSKDQNKRKEKLTKLVNRLKDHPALVVWEVPDEALWNLSLGLYRRFYGPQWSPEQQDSILNYLSTAVPEKAQGIAEGSKQLRHLDPLHPIWMNHAPRNAISELRLFSKTMDIVGCDIYPVKEGITGHSDLIDHSLSAVGGFTDIMQNSAPGKPIWMVLQAFSWELLRNPIPEHLNPEMFPTYKQSRTMAWNAILHDAKGILYWGSHMVSSKSLFWDAILGVTKEIAALEPFLLGNELKEMIKVEPIQFSASLPTRVAYTLRKYKDDYLLAVLQEDLLQSINVSGLDFLEGKTLYELTTDRSYLVKNGKIRLWFGMEPHVLCTSRNYDVVHESQFILKWDNEDNFPLNEKK